MRERYRLVGHNGKTSARRSLALLNYLTYFVMFRCRRNRKDLWALNDSLAGKG